MRSIHRGRAARWWLVVALLAAHTLAGSPLLRAQQADSGFFHDKADQHFVQSAAGDGLHEVSLAMLAERKASDARVKSFAQRLLATHTKTNDELTTLARIKGISIPSGLDAGQQATYDRLIALSGATFDREYLETMVVMHESQVGLFELESGVGLDAEARAWASRLLPSIREHLQESRNLR